LLVYLFDRVRHPPYVHLAVLFVLNRSFVCAELVLAVLIPTDLVLAALTPTELILVPISSY
jgi:hypothetical protein